MSASIDSTTDVFDLRRLMGILWSGRWLLSGFAVFSALVGVGIALWLPDVYRSEALLTPNEQDASGGLSALASQYGGLASLAGINLGGESTDGTAMGLEVLKSRRFITDFVERRGLLVPLMAATGWDAKSGDLVIDPDIYDTGSASWVREATAKRPTVPTPLEAYERFLEILSVNRDAKTGFVTISISFFSPELTKTWVDWLVADINEFMMRQDVSEAEASIQYLNEQISNTSLSDLQAVFFRLIEEQTKTVMLARVSEEYLLKTLDPAFVPELPVKPNRPGIVLLALLVGGALGMLVHLLMQQPAGRGASGARSE